VPVGGSLRLERVVSTPLIHPTATPSGSLSDRGNVARIGRDPQKKDPLHLLTLPCSPRKVLQGTSNHGGA